MKRLLPVLGLLMLASAVSAQVDIESRRTLTLQTSMAVYRSEEQTIGFGYFWFNQNNYPWTNTALRVVFAGIFADAELSCFLPANTNIAVGVGGGGGLFLETITPYRDGERLTHDSFLGDAANARVFINETIPNPTPLPINVRGTYALSGAFYRAGDGTKNFVIPRDFLVQSVMAELRLGGIEPGLTARRGAELYLALDANYRTGFEAFGPVGTPYPAHAQYDRAFASLSGKIPLAQTTLYARLCGGLGERLDQLSAWKLGGNALGLESLSFQIHGYYLREFYADDFGLGNLDWSFPILPEWGLTGHVYGDWAAIKPPPPEPGDWHNYFGVAAGFGLRGPWQTDWLVSYGYGVNALRNGDRGGHEIGLALEKKF
jgi:hypothetical protein